MLLTFRKFWLLTTLFLWHSYLQVIPQTGRKKGSYIVRGKIKRISNTKLHITELPIGTATQKYKEHLEKMLTVEGAGKKKKTGKRKKDEEEEVDEGAQEPDITDFKENHTDTTVSFTIISTKEKIDAFEEEKDGLIGKVRDDVDYILWLPLKYTLHTFLAALAIHLIGKFKLSTTISSKNMTAFDEDGAIQQYNSSLEIMQAFFRQRSVFYIARKDMLLHKMRKDLRWVSWRMWWWLWFLLVWVALHLLTTLQISSLEHSMLENKARFVEEVCKGELVVSNRKRTLLLVDLNERGYDLFPKDPKEVITDGNESDSGEDGDMDDVASDAALAKGYEYLLGMKIWTLTFERAEELRRQRAEKAEEVEALDATSPESLWSADLDAIEDLLDEGGIEGKKQKKQAKNKKVVKKTGKNKDEVSLFFSFSS